MPVVDFQFGCITVRGDRDLLTIKIGDIQSIMKSPFPDLCIPRDVFWDRYTVERLFLTGTALWCMNNFTDVIYSIEPTLVTFTNGFYTCGPFPRIDEDIIIKLSTPKPITDINQFSTDLKLVAQKFGTDDLPIPIYIAGAKLGAILKSLNSTLPSTQSPFITTPPKSKVIPDPFYSKDRGW